MRRYSWRWLMHDERGGGSKSSPPQVIPAPPPPDIGKTAAESTAAQLQNNPLLAAQQVQLQGQYGPQLAQQQFDLFSQFAPQYRGLTEQNFPQIRTLSDQTQQGLQSNRGYSDQQQAAIDAIRNREQERGLRGIREGANLGGTLYGGRRQEAEANYLTQQGQAYSAQDIALQQQQRQQTMQELLSLFQLAGFNVQQPSVQQFGTSPAASGDALYGALVNNAGNFGVIPGTAGRPSQAGGIIQGLGSAALAKASFACLPGTTLIDVVGGTIPIQAVTAGDCVHFPDGTEDVILFKYEFIEMPITFITLVFDDHTKFEACDQHEIEGRALKAYAIGEILQGKRIIELQTSIRTEKAYDLLTNRPQGVYPSSGLIIDSMIPKLHRLTQLLEEVMA